MTVRNALVPLAALAASVVAALVVSSMAVGNRWIVDRLVVVACVLVALGLVAGSPRAVTLSAAPALGAALTGLWPSTETAWGAALLAGSLWYLVVELGWAGVAGFEGVRHAPSVQGRRIRDIASVILVTVVVGIASALVARRAPTLTLLLQGLALGATLAAVAAISSLIGSSEPESDASGAGLGPGPTDTRHQR